MGEVIADLLLYSADRCRRYAMMRNQGLAEDSPPKKYIPRRRAQDKDVTCLKMDIPPDLAFETASCLLFPSLPVEHQKQHAAADSKASVCADALVLESAI